MPLTTVNAPVLNRLVSFFLKLKCKHSAQSCFKPTLGKTGFQTQENIKIFIENKNNLKYFEERTRITTFVERAGRKWQNKIAYSVLLPNPNSY